jgi:hypothetical protein
MFYLPFNTLMFYLPFMYLQHVLDFHQFYSGHFRHYFISYLVNKASPSFTDILLDQMVINLETDVVQRDRKDKCLLKVIPIAWQVLMFYLPFNTLMFYLPFMYLQHVLDFHQFYSGHFRGYICIHILYF